MSQPIRLIDIPTSSADISDNTLKKNLRVLLMKPFHSITALLQAPPLGLLYISSSIREKLGNYVDVKIVDMNLQRMEP